MKRLLRFTGRVAAALITLLPVAAVGGVIAPMTVPRLLGLDGVIVLSGSMELALHEGSLALIEPLEGADAVEADEVIVRSLAPPHVAVGDIIVFDSPKFPGLLFSHRVAEVVEPDEDGQGVSFVTKGDTNRVADNFLVPAENVEGKVRFQIPYVGHVAKVLRDRENFYLLLGIPTALLVAHELWIVVWELRRWRVSQREEQAML